MAKLSARLEQLRALRGQPSRDRMPAKGAIRRPDTELWEGWREVSPCVWRKRTILPLGEEVPPSPGLLLEDRSDLGRLVFYDFETTGLSGGAGTMIFLAGFATVTPQSIEVEQLFLTDYPGEAGFLREILSILDLKSLFVSYNGKSFDRNILISRFRLNRMECNIPLQLDLLYPSRTLWRSSLENCSLGQVEEDILGIRRSEDIPGALIPQCYHDFLQGRNAECMRRVVAHHLQDIVSLVKLLFLLERLPSQPQLLAHPDARVGLGFLLLRKEDRRGVDILERELAAGMERAGTGLVPYYKRRGKLAELHRVLERMLQIRAGYFQSQEMAKLLEHRFRQPEKAFRIVEELLRRNPVLTPRQRAAVEHRRRRLAAKSGASVDITSPLRKTPSVPDTD